MSSLRPTLTPPSIPGYNSTRENEVHQSPLVWKEQRMSIEQQAPAGGFIVTLTSRAAEEVQKFITSEQVPAESAGLRVSVLPGGCSGFKYSLNIEERALEDDLVQEFSGVRVFVDGFSAQYLTGITIDYVSSMQGSGFTFNNPNATGGCGCGSSFTA
jgi:iron-sulfur cluster assembly protein